MYALFFMEEKVLKKKGKNKIKKYHVFGCAIRKTTNDVRNERTIVQSAKNVEHYRQNDSQGNDSVEQNDIERHRHSAY